MWTLADTDYALAHNHTYTERVAQMYKWRLWSKLHAWFSKGAQKWKQTLFFSIGACSRFLFLCHFSWTHAHPSTLTHFFISSKSPSKTLLRVSETGNERKNKSTEYKHSDVTFLLLYTHAELPPDGHWQYCCCCEWEQHRELLHASRKPENARGCACEGFEPPGFVCDVFSEKGIVCGSQCKWACVCVSKRFSATVFAPMFTAAQVNIKCVCALCMYAWMPAPVRRSLLPGSGVGWREEAFSVLSEV